MSSHTRTVIDWDDLKKECCWLMKEKRWKLLLKGLAPSNCHTWMVVLWDLFYLKKSILPTFLVKDLLMSDWHRKDVHLVMQMQWHKGKWAWLQTLELFFFFKGNCIGGTLDISDMYKGLCFDSLLFLTMYLFLNAKSFLLLSLLLLKQFCIRVFPWFFC